MLSGLVIFLDERILVELIKVVHTIYIISAGENAAVCRKAAFLDRDGLINLDRAYVHR